MDYTYEINRIAEELAEMRDKVDEMALNIYSLDDDIDHEELENMRSELENISSALDTAENNLITC